MLNVSDMLGLLFSVFLDVWYIIPLLILVIFLKNYKSKKKNKEKKNTNKFNEDKENLYQKLEPIKIVDTKEKGEKYEAFICEKYKQLGYIIAPHGKDNGVRDQGIDIIAKKDKEILFIQCKDWNVEHKHRIGNKEIQYIRMNVRDYIKRNPLYENYDWKILYITSENILDKSGHYKIVENSDEIEHKIIPITIK